MDSVLKNRKINSPFGILFQIPVFIICAFGLLQLAYMFYLSLTNFNGMAAPSFNGLENYINIFKDELVLKSLGNTVVMVLAVTLLLFVTAVLPALLISKLKLRFGIVVIGAFSAISIFATLYGFLRYVFDNSGLLNQLIGNEFIPFIETHARLVAVIVLWLYCLAPVFAITYILAKMKHSFAGTAIAVCSIPVLMYFGGNIQVATIGNPSVRSSADWLYTVFYDYFHVKYYIGFSYAILFVGIMMLILWCLAVCFAILGFKRILPKVKTDCHGFKTAGYISFSLSLLLFLVVLFCLVFYLLRAFMPIEEFYLYPYIFIPRNPTLENFVGIFRLSGNIYLYNSLLVVPLVIMPMCLFVALPSGVGFSLFKSFKKEKLLLLCFIPFLFAFSYITLAKLGLGDTYFAYAFEFLSSVEFFMAVFLVYITVKLVFSGGKKQVPRILLGSFFLLSSFYAIGAIRGIWCRSDLIFSEELKTLNAVNFYALGNVIASVIGILMLLATIAVLIVPIILFIILYRSYQKKH